MSDITLAVISDISNNLKQKILPLFPVTEFIERSILFKYPEIATMCSAMPSCAKAIRRTYVTRRPMLLVMSEVEGSCFSCFCLLGLEEEVGESNGEAGLDLGVIAFSSSSSL